MKKNITVSFVVAFVFVLSFIPAIAAENYEILLNPGFEQDVDYWSPYSTATLDIVEDQPQEGNKYVFVSNKYNAVDCPRQYITEQLTYYGQGVYHVSGWVKSKGDISGEVKARIVVQTQSSDKTFQGETQYPGQYWNTTDEVVINSETWTKLEGEIELIWSETLEMSEFYFLLSGDGAMDNYYVDNCSMYKVDYTGDPYETESQSSTSEESVISEVEPTQTSDVSQDSSDELTEDSTTITTPVMIAIGAGVLILIGLGLYMIISSKKSSSQ